jgi:hypothetical protein
MRPRGQQRGGTRRTRRRVVATLIAAAALLAVPASAQALTVSGTAAPTDTTAGAHSDFNITINFGPADQDVQNLTVGLPPGVTGDPTATPQCTEAQLNSATPGNDGCPAETQVGTVVANATITLIAAPVTLNVSGKLYNLTPQPGEPARFGIVLQPGVVGGLALPLAPVILQSGAALRQTDFGLDTIINNIPNATPNPLLIPPTFPTHINSQTITLFGEPADHSVPGTPKPFMRNPTSCTPKVTNFSATPHPPATGTATATSPPFTPTNCGALDFSPSFSAIVGGANASMKTSVTTSIDQDSEEAGLVKAQVAIPPDLNPDVALLGNRCSPADFEASICPPNSVMGSAIATSPLLTQPLAGNVVFVETGATPDIGLDLQGQLHLLLRGTLGLDKVVVFDGLPDIPIAHFALTFPSSPGLLIASRNLCVPPPPLFHADFTGYNGATTAVDSPATVQGSCAPNPVNKCKKAKKKHKKKHRAAESKKKHKKKSCKKKKRKHKKRH